MNTETTVLRPVGVRRVQKMGRTGVGVEEAPLVDGVLLRHAVQIDHRAHDAETEAVLQENVALNEAYDELDVEKALSAAIAKKAADALEVQEAAVAIDDSSAVLLDHLGDIYQALGRSEEAIDAWRQAVGRAALICYSAGETLRVVDSRTIASKDRGVLRGIEKEIYCAADRGVSLQQLAHRLGQAPGEIEARLEPLLDHRWLAQLDGRYLSLAVPVDSWVPRGVPAVMVEETLVAKYSSRMAQLFSLSSGASVAEQEM